MDRDAYLQDIAQRCIQMSGAVVPCTQHPDVLTRAFESAAEREAYRLGKLELARDGQAGLQTLMEREIKQAIDEAAEYCRKCGLLSVL